MNFSSIPILAFLAPLVVFYQQTKNFVLKILRVFWKSRVLPWDCGNNFVVELMKTSLVTDFDDYKIETFEYYSLKNKRSVLGFFKVNNFFLVLYEYCVPVFVFATQEGLKIQYIKFTFPFEKILRKVISEYNHETVKFREEKSKERFYVESIKGKSLKSFKDNNNTNQSYPASPAPMSPSIVDYKVFSPYYIVHFQLPNKLFNEPIKNALASFPQESLKNKYQFTEKGKYILSQVQKWLAAEKWYLNHNIPWRRGILLNGKPGNGKSSLILEIAKKVSIPLYIFDLSSMDNTEFEQSLNMLCLTSAIILIEDIDSVFDKRENLTKTNQFGGLTFDFFINKLSGADSIKNKFVFITTNHLDKLDEALLRPGRMDEILDIPPLNQEEKTKLASIILGDDFLVNQVIIGSENDTTAEFENKCIKLALNTFWNQNSLES